MLYSTAVMGDRMRWFIKILLVLVACAGSSGHFAHAGVPFTKDAYGRILVPVELGDGQERLFLLDTAARRFGLTSSILPHQGIKRFQGSNIRHVSSAGTLNLSLAKIRNVRFDENRREDMVAAIFPVSPFVEGLAGFDAYHGYLLHVDPQSNQLALHANSEEFARAGWRLISGSPNSYGGLLIESHYAGKPITVLLASGLSHSVIDVRAAKLLFPDRFKKGKFQKDRKKPDLSVVMGLMPNSHLLKPVVLKDFNVEGWELGDVEFGIDKLPVDRNRSAMNAPLLMLGADILANHEYVLDTRGHQLWLPPVK